MKQITTEAIVLRSLAFKDRQKILTIFSKEFGIISIILKGLSSKRSFKNSFSEPFCKAEFTLHKKGGDLFTFEEGSILDMHLSLRENLSHLKTSSSMVQALLISQLPERPSEALYTLFSLFLSQIKSFPCQNTLLACFYLKILLHEGISPVFSEDENILLEDEKLFFTEITKTKSFAQLREKKISLEHFQKLERVFLIQMKG